MRRTWHNLSMRQSWHNWILRFAALLIFVSSGALARAMAKDIETHFAPLERQQPEQHYKAVTLEVRQPAPVQLDGAVLAQPNVQPTPAKALGQTPKLEQHVVVAVLRAFDALAPPAM